MSDHTTRQSPEVNIPYGYCHCGCGQKTNLARQNDTKRGLVKGEPYRYLHGHRNRKPTLEAAFWSYVTPDEPDVCWEWPGCKFPNGYGVLRFHKKNYYAHRISYELHHGSIPDGMFICHKCDNPSCWNPNHLFLGTPLDNTRDMIAKGRNVVLRGSKSSRAKLTYFDAETVRQMYSAGESVTDIMARFSISQTTVYAILKGKRWKTDKASNSILHRDRGIKLTRDDVIEIRRLRAMGEPLRAIAEQFGISFSTISNIASRKIWKHVA